MQQSLHLLLQVFRLSRTCRHGRTNMHANPRPNATAQRAAHCSAIDAAELRTPLMLNRDRDDGRGHALRGRIF